MRQNLELPSILRTFRNEIGKARECCVSRLKRSLSGSLPMFATTRRTSSLVMRPMESSGLAALHHPVRAEGTLKPAPFWVRISGYSSARGLHVCLGIAEVARSTPAYMPKRQFTPARTMFSFKVLRAPAPTHIHSPFALKFGVMPYSTPAPAARPG